MEVASLVLGIIGLLIGWIPFFGFPIPVIGLILGILGRKKGTKKGLALAGMIMSIIGLFGAIIWTGAGSYDLVQALRR
jgi:hypothetical protein